MGLPASGKTTVGQAVADELGLGWCDTDALVEQRTGRLVREIFADEGEERFRELEQEAVAHALAHYDVVCLGGGSVMTPAVRQMLDGHSVVWLDVSVVTLTRRAGMSTLRPLLLGDLRARLGELAGQRLPVYELVATWRIDADRPVRDIVRDVVDLIQGVRVIRVAAENPYDVLIGPGVSARVGSLLASAEPAVAKTAVLYPPVLADRVAKLAADWPDPVLIEVPEAEQAKTVDTLDRCWRTLAEAGLTRSDAVVGVGGGTTTDLAGFVAATYLRGISYVSIPTTVLAMADAAVGGKTGINLPQGKNLVGSFYEPRLVTCDLDLLAGLGDHEVRSGLAEIVKCGFISDPDILDTVIREPKRVCDVTSAPFADILARAIQVKADVVSGDLREAAVSSVGRAALNYGHTLGHAIEKLENFTWSHGYAISVGMVFVAEVAHRLGMVGDDVVDTHRRVLTSLGLPTEYNGAWADVRATMSIDKKARGSHLRLILLEDIGRTAVVADVDEPILAQSFQAIQGVV